MSRTRRTLKASPPGSTSWVYIADDASLVVEFYDHGEQAEASFGHDVAFLLRLPPDQKRPLLAALRGASGEPGAAPERDGFVARLRRRIRTLRSRDDVDVPLLDELERHFGSYFEVRAWLDGAGIPYTHEFDSWA